LYFSLHENLTNIVQFKVQKQDIFLGLLNPDGKTQTLQTLLQEWVKNKVLFKTLNLLKFQMLFIYMTDGSTFQSSDWCQVHRRTTVAAVQHGDPLEKLISLDV
jgi:hypothetical protein